MAAQQHTPFHAPWAVAGPHGYQLSEVGGTRNEEGSAPPMAPYSLRALWAQEVGATHLQTRPLRRGGQFHRAWAPSLPGALCARLDPTRKPFPGLVERASLLPSPRQQGPCLPQRGPHIVQEAEGGLDQAQPKQ